MTAEHNPTRRKAMQMAAGAVAMAALPVPVIARLQLEGEFTAPPTNVRWKPIDEARRFEKRSNELFEVGLW